MDCSVVWGTGTMVWHTVRGLAFVAVGGVASRVEHATLVLLLLALVTGAAKLSKFFSSAVAVCVFCPIIGFDSLHHLVAVGATVATILFRMELGRDRQPLLALLILVLGFGAKNAIHKALHGRESQISLLSMPSWVVGLPKNLLLIGIVPIAVALTVAVVYLLREKKRLEGEAIEKERAATEELRYTIEHSATLRSRVKKLQREKQELLIKEQELQLDVKDKVLRSMPLQQLNSLQQKTLALLASIQTAQEDYRLCKVCLDAESTAMILPCKHLCLCEECVTQLELCPLCRSPVEEHIVLRYS